MKLNDNNILLKEWLERYNKQNESIKKELDRLHGDLVQGKNNNFQLLKIKRSYKYPEKGDIFVFQPRDNIFFYGLVLNAHVNNLQGEDMYVVALFRSKSKSVDEFSFVLDYSKLLLAPLIKDSATTLPFTSNFSPLFICKLELFKSNFKDEIS